MFNWALNILLVLATMFKTDNSKNRLKNEICLKLTLKPLEQNREKKSITVNKHIFKNRRPNN